MSILEKDILFLSLHIQYQHHRKRIGFLAFPRTIIIIIVVVEPLRRFRWKEPMPVLVVMVVVVGAALSAAYVSVSNVDDHRRHCFDDDVDANSSFRSLLNCH